MVELGEGLGGMMPNISTTGILNGLMWFLIGALILGTLGFITWYIVKKKKYNEFLVEILDKDSNGNVYKTYDRAGVFLDKKTGYRLLFLEKAKIGLNPNKIPYISHKTKKGKLVKTVYLRRIGVNNYVFIDLKLGETIKFTIGEEDLNNAAQEMNKIRRTYDKKSWLDKLLAPMIFIVTIMIVMIIIISLFNKFGILETVSTNMLEVTEAQAEITALLLEITNSTIQQEQGYATIITPSSG
jgi:hypothetical protein